MNSLLRVDVFANDQGVSRDDAAALTLIAQPDCGHAVVRNGTIEFLAGAECSGVQKIDYSVKGVSQIATVAVQLVNPSAAPAAETEATVAAVEPVKPAPNVQPEPAPSESVVAVTPVPAGPEQSADASDDAAQQAALSIETDTTETESSQTESGQADNSLADNSQTESSSVATETSAVDPVRAVAATAPGLPQGGELAEPALATLTGGYTGETVSAAEIKPLGRGTQKDDSASESSNTLLATLGLSGGSDSHADAGVMMMVIDRGYSGVDVPVAPAYGLVGQPALPSGSAEARAPGQSSAAAVPVALSGTPVLGAAAPVGEALSIDPVDQNEMPYEDLLAARKAEADANAAAAKAAAEAEAKAEAEARAAAEAQKDIQVAALQAEDKSKDLGAAAAPSGTADCIVPPSVTFSPGRAAQTTVAVAAPCLGGTVAEIAYDNLRLAVALDVKGEGSITVPGFDAYAPGTISFANGESLEVELPFRDLQRVSRVAIVWNAPVALELNALEFGAAYGDEAHVSPANPRGFREIRKTGGGFLTQHTAIDGAGQNVQVYTHLHRQGGNTGAVKLMIDFASRSRDGIAAACGTGEHAAPTFDVLRTYRGGPQRQTRRQLAAMDCSSAVSSDPSTALIGGAVEDLLITPR
ncbi:MAG: hypothetical protein AAFV19_08225 [Pseudomonadota bacterium]